MEYLKKLPIALKAEVTGPLFEENTRLWFHT